VDRAGTPVPLAAVSPHDGREPGAIGREARLELTFEVRNRRTVVSRMYAEPPFRPVRTFDVDGAAHVILVTAAPGIFGGDRLRLSITVGPGARVVMASQASLQAHPSEPDALACLRHEYRIAAGGELYCQWDPTIPFAGARLDQRFALALDRGSRLLWSDALTCGRVASGEVWQFHELRHELALRVDGNLEYLERYRLRPGERSGTGPWQAGRHTCLGTAVTWTPPPGPDPDVLADLQRELTSIPGVLAAVDAPAPCLSAARILASDGVAFRLARVVARDRLAARWLERTVAFRR
jgi:urease accessory protein UreH